MKRSLTNAIARIDRALKRVYNLDSPHRAEQFLLTSPMAVEKVANASMGGALYLRPGPDEQDLDLGIYLSEGVRNTLETFSRWKSGKWTFAQVAAFSVAAEEVSHFHYLLYHLESGRGVSQLELELQGEVDKFVLAYFALRGNGQNARQVFDSLFEQLFGKFRWVETLGADERSRYEAANRFARRFLTKCASDLAHPRRLDDAFARLRKFYRLSPAEKISYVTF